MLQKYYRLPASVRLIRSATVTTPLFLFKSQENKLPVSRFGFVVRKTVDKRATARNRIRRVFRSCIEEMLPKIKEGLDMLFILRQPLLEMKREELYNVLYAFLKERQLLT